MKDPAVLFYYRDFQHGTRRMTMEGKGVYIELLCEQCDSASGSIDKPTFESLLELPCDEDIAEILRKFEQDENGMYNERMRAEINRRRKYSESRANNRKKKTYEKDMIKTSEHMKKTSKKKGAASRFVKPTADELCTYFREKMEGGLTLPEVEITTEASKFWDYYTSNGWKVGKNPMKDWKAAVRNWIKNLNNYGKKQPNKSKTAKDQFTDLVNYRSSRSS